MEKIYKIKEQDLQQILNYLSTKPYNEVFQGINTLTNLEEINGNNKK